MIIIPTLPDPKTEAKEFHLPYDLPARKWLSQVLNLPASKGPGFW